MLALAACPPTAAAQPTTAATTAPEQLTEAQETELATLSKWLHDESLSPENRRQAATLLLNKGWPAAQAVLVEVLSNRQSPAGRLAVANALAASAPRDGRLLSERFVDPLFQALADGNEQLRKAAACALALYRDKPEVVERLGRLLLDPAGPAEGRRGAIAAFAWMPPSEKSIDALVRVLRDKDPDVRVQATEALNRLTAAGLADPTAWEQWWADNRNKPPLDWVSTLNQRLNQENLELRQQREQLEKRLVSALDTIYQATPLPQQGDLLMKYLADPLPAVRVLGLRLVDRLVGQNAAVPEPARKAVHDRLTDESAQVRAAAADVIGYLGEPRRTGAISQLLAQLAVETDANAKCMMIKTLGSRLKAAEAIGALLKLLAESKDRAVGCEAASGLGAIAGTGRLAKEAVEPVAAALLDRYSRLTPDEPEMRDAVVTAMADIADTRFVPVFVKGLGDESATVRQASARGLGGAVAPGSSQAGEMVTALVGRLSSESDRGVRLALISALGKLGPGRSQLEAIYVRTNPTNEPDESVRRRAWETFTDLLKSADKPAQLAWLQQLESNPPESPGSAAWLADLLLSIETTAKPERWTEAERQSLAERVADALVKAKRPAEAAPRYEQLYRKLAQDKSDRAETVAVKCFGALLAANQPAPAVELWKQFLQNEPRNPQALADAMLQQLRLLVEGTDPGGPASAMAIIQEIRRQLPQHAQTAAWAGPLNQLADKAAGALAAQLLEQVRKALDQMTGSDAAVAAAARKRIEQLGPAALPVLLNELEAAVEAGEQARAREQAIVGLLAGPPVNAKDWDPTAPPDRKKALLAQYRKRLQPATNGG